MRPMAICRFLTYLTMIATLILSSSNAIGQTRSLGATFSFTGVSIAYDIQSGKKDAFLELDLKAECAEFYSGRSEFPGVSASASWNSYLKKWESDGGASVSLFAGPGITLGYTSDNKRAGGIIFGLEGIVGVECSFKRNVIVSASFAPMIGSHILIGKESAEMNFYRNGIQYALIPEIGIRYRF